MSEGQAGIYSARKTVRGQLNKAKWLHDIYTQTSEQQRSQQNHNLKINKIYHVNRC